MLTLVETRRYFLFIGNEVFMVISHDKNKDYNKIMRKIEKKDLTDYCREMGFSKKETKKIVDRALSALFKEDQEGIL